MSTTLYLTETRAAREYTCASCGAILGVADRYSAFVNFSDGGRFENLGLYEVVLRCCRLVMVADASCDTSGGFGDLGNAIRKIPVDFGIPIEFQGDIRIPVARNSGQLKQGAVCALATIRYDLVDGPAGRRGTPICVRSYALTTRFPRESTADQWFSESQFDSYRALGKCIADAVIGDPRPSTLAEFEAAVRRTIAGSQFGAGGPARHATGAAESEQSH